MLKACTLFKFRRDWKPEDAREYWLTKHADVLRGYPFFRRYVQSHPILSAKFNQAPAYDGFAEVWVENTQQLREAAAGQGYRAIAEDETKFIDTTYTDLVLAEEHTLIDAPLSADDVKLVHLVKRTPGIDPAAYQRDWLEGHQSSVIAQRSPKKLVVSLAKLSGYRDGLEPRWDIIVSEWCDPAAAVLQQPSVSKEDVAAKEVATLATIEHLIAEF